MLAAAAALVSRWAASSLLFYVTLGTGSLGAAWYALVLPIPFPHAIVEPAPSASETLRASESASPTASPHASVSPRSSASHELLDTPTPNESSAGLPHVSSTPAPTPIVVVPTPPPLPTLPPLPTAEPTPAPSCRVLVVVGGVELCLTDAVRR